MFFPAPEQPRYSKHQRSQTAPNRKSIIPYKPCNFSFNKRLQILVNSVDCFQSLNEAKLLQSLIKHNCFRIDNHKYIIDTIDLYHTILNESDCSFASNLIPEMTFSSLKPLGLTLKIKPNQYIHYKSDESQVNLEEVLPQSFYERLYEFQKEGIRFGVSNFGRVLIGDEMGVGKTIQGLGLAYIYKQQWPLLILCPSLLMLNWRDEALKWIKELNSNYIQVLQKQKDEISKSSKVIITSYDLATHHLKHFQKLNISITIADEAHHLKSAISKRSLALVPFLKTQKHVILLTGTPALAKPKELFNMLSIIRPDVFFSFKTFGNRYCDPKKSRFKEGLEYEGSSNSIELYSILTRSIMIRRLKRDVLDQLPSKVRQNIKIAVDKNIQKEIQAIIKENPDKIENAFNGGRNQQYNPQIQENYSLLMEEEERSMQPTTLQLIQKCYSLTGEAKLNGICEFLDDIIDDSSDQKFIIFAHHISVLDGIEAKVNKKKWQFMRIDGTVSIKERHERIGNFQTNPFIKIAILSLTAASVGITLTAASTVIFCELHWTPGVMMQAEDRAHRIGQKNCVTCIYLLGEKTLDDKIYSVLERKLSTVEFILDGARGTHYDALESIQNQTSFRRPTELSAPKPSQPLNTLERYFQKERKISNEALDFLNELEEPQQDKQMEDLFAEIEEICSKSKQSQI